LKNFKDLLKKPSRESQPWAIWIWNLTITPSELEKQFNWFVENGFGGIVIRPSREMVPAYLSEEFMELFAIVLKNAQKHEIGIRIADDFSLPWSGCFSGDMAQSVKMRAQQLRLIETRPLTERETITLTDKDSNLDIVLAVKSQNGVIDPASVVELCGGSTARPAHWQAPEGDWKLLHLRKETVYDPSGSCVPNIFNPKAASVYIQEVLEVLKGEFIKFIPATFEGFVNELPTLLPGNNSIPWDDDLVVKFRTKSKKNMIALLPALFCENYPGAQKNRQQIYSFINESAFERFVAPIEAWAKKNRFSQWVLAPESSVYGNENVLVDGAVPPETDLNAVGFQNIDGAAENYAMLRIMADANTNEFRRETLQIIGRNRNSVGATVQSLKCDTDSLLLSGSSKILIDGYFFNLDQRSYVKSPLNPGWYTPGNTHIKNLCTYMARSNEITRNVHWNRQVAVLAPTSEIMASYMPGTGNASAAGMERLGATIRALDRCGISYDCVSTNLLAGCTVRSNGEFGTADRIRKGNYQALIIPFAPALSRDVLIFIEKLVQKEGCVYFIEEAPEGTIEDGQSPTMSSRIDKILSERHKGTGIIKLDELESALQVITPHVRILVNGKIGSDVYQAFGAGDGYDLYLFHNISETKEQSTIIELADNKHFTMIDCENGEMHEITPFEQADGLARFQFVAYPKTTVIVVASSASIIHGSKEASKPPRRSIPFGEAERGYRIVLKDQWQFSTGSLNALPLANWSVRIGLSRESGGFSHYYETNFQAKSLPGVARLLLDTAGMRRGSPGRVDLPFEVTVNGTRLDADRAARAVQAQQQTEAGADPAAQPAFDDSVPSHFVASGRLYDIADLLTRGFNRVSIRTTGLALDPDTLRYPPLIFGDFSLAKGQNGWAIDQPAETMVVNSWIGHGYPYLCGKGVYQQSFEIPNDYQRLVLRFSKVSGPVDVTLNGKHLGVFSWHPIEIDITSVCEAKRNELVVGVYNSIDTILRLNGRPSGLIGDVYLDVY
jgi:hypothetical protein